MASKRKKRSKGRSAVTLIDRVKRNLERGDFKQALKDVRVCYRQNPTSDCRSFLEHAYIGRAQQLLRKGLTEDSRRIVRPVGGVVHVGSLRVSMRRKTDHLSVEQPSIQKRCGVVLRR